jgi:hypothetical protein
MSFSDTQITTKIYHMLDHNGNVSKFHKGDSIQATLTYSSTIIRKSLKIPYARKLRIYTQTHRVPNNY